MIWAESRSRIQNEEMNLDLQTYSPDRLTRDRRFDGKFLIGVVGNGVDCRPICPALIAKEKNVRDFPSAAAAPRIAANTPCNISRLPVGV
jgi:AraC family transcriptional regulator of adaptative response / DNA-3-methyladenine glycosylase II